MRWCGCGSNIATKSKKKNECKLQSILYGCRLSKMRSLKIASNTKQKLRANKMEYNEITLIKAYVSVAQSTTSNKTTTFCYIRIL